MVFHGDFYNFIFSYYNQMIYILENSQVVSYTSAVTMLPNRHHRAEKGPTDFSAALFRENLPDRLNSKFELYGT